MKTRGCTFQRKTTKVSGTPAPRPARPRCPRRVPVERPAPRARGAPTPRAGARGSRPSRRASRSGKFPPLPLRGPASTEHVVPMKSRVRGKVPQVSALPGFLAFASKAGRPVWPRRRAGERLLRGPLLCWGAAGNARDCAHPRETSPAPVAPQAAPRPLFPKPLPRAVRSGSRVGGGGGGCSCASQRASSLPALRLLGFSTPPTSPLPLTLSEPTPGVLLFAPQCGLAPEEGKRLEAPVMCGLCFSMFSGNHERV